MSLESNLRALAHNPLLSVMDVEARRLIAFSSEILAYRQGDIIFRKGDKSDAGYFILSGSIELRRDQAGAFESEIAQKYFLIGEMAMITETARPATAFARERTEVIKITRAVFHKVLREFPDSALQVRMMIEKRVGYVINELSHVFQS
jgi:CRP-like cAMP-binding protein